MADGKAAGRAPGTQEALAPSDGGSGLVDALAALAFTDGDRLALSWRECFAERPDGFGGFFSRVTEEPHGDGGFGGAHGGAYRVIGPTGRRR